MASSHTSLTRLLTPILSTFRSSMQIHTLKATTSAIIPSRAFSSTPNAQAGGHPSPRPGWKNKNVKDPRIKLIRYHMQHPKTPRPLKLSRMRALRHWTIHRAWMLAQRKRVEGEERELMRMYQSMHAACEELRLLDPPGTKDAGRLYRIAMEKKGIFGHGGVPIEYARAQTETPGREPWNHSWTR
ncbi:hypothetical protein LCER1_G005804 [Lachnellula cervina]|uniref:Large ribosomal subunit protein mL40 n=1 Tax=Lachnellula cervina TaxID=1316786 RepID=A0A7D8UQ44_9HELO|nr:hypothetical protein LCER1_G005804 [Lachnellula cervina]